MVDMTADQLAVPKGAITLQDGGIDLDMLLPDTNWRDDFEDRPQGQGHHVARAADITLTTGNELNFDLDDGAFGFDLGVGDGIASQDFDLGLDFGDAGRDDMSIEMGRDGPKGSRMSVDSRVMGDPDADVDVLSRLSREASVHAPNMDVDMGFGDLGDLGDLGLNFGDEGLSEREKTPGEARSPSRACEYFGGSTELHHNTPNLNRH